MEQPNGQFIGITRTKCIFTAPDQVPNRPLSLTLEDSNGNLQVVRISIQAGELGAYDLNANGLLERTELYQAVKDFKSGQLPDTTMRSLLEQFFE